MAAKRYNTRGKHVDYKASDIIFPVARRPRPQKSKLYPLEVIERDNVTGKVKVHYIGYGSNGDEWNDDDIVELRSKADYMQPTYLIAPAIKSLQSSRKGNPEVKIVMDLINFSLMV